MQRTFDWKTFGLMMIAAGIGAAWAIYNRGLTAPPYNQDTEFRPLIWVVFATPFALFWGWLLARPRERWLAAFVCFCIYFFSPFVAARYESCTVLQGTFSLADCFAGSGEAQLVAESNGHIIYFQAIVIIHLIAALAVAIQRAVQHRGSLAER